MQDAERSEDGVGVDEEISECESEREVRYEKGNSLEKNRLNWKRQKKTAFNMSWLWLFGWLFLV